MKVKAYWKIIPCAFPVDGYLYNVQEWRSVDGGKTFCYCGIGKFCKTIDESLEYIKERAYEGGKSYAVHHL